MSSAVAMRSPDTERGRAATLTGTATLIGVLLRRDRIKLPAWTLGIAVFVVYYAAALPTLFPTDEDLQAAAAFSEGPVGALLGGPGYGYDALTIERFLVGQYGLYFLLAAALMNILLVSRHTRVEEQTGRAELVRANVVGRHAPLTAALAVALLSNVALGGLVALGMLASGFDPGGSAVFGASVGAAGLSFAAVTGVTVQVTEYSRAASGIAGAILGAAFVIRAAGDMMSDHGSLLSWFSPLAWSQQTAPFVVDRWWPLLLSLGFTVVAGATGYTLSVRRDVAGALIPARRGPAEAAPWLASVFTLAYRLQRASLIGWASGLFVAGLLYGALTGPIVDSFQDMSPELLAFLGGEDDLLLGYLGLMGLIMALTVAIFAILAVQSVRAEETTGRAEPILSTATSRAAWLGSSLTITALGVVALLAVAGVATGIGAAVGADDPSLLWEVALGHVAHAPAVLTTLALAALLFGIAPRAIPVTWAVLLYGLIVGFFAPLMDLPGWAQNLSPFDHLAQMPLEDPTLAPMLVLGGLTAAGIAAALWAFRRRDLTSN